MNENVETVISPTRSEQLFQQALKVLPGGVSRNTIYRKPHPFYAQKGYGCFVLDADGVERIDFANNMASLIHGHTYGPVVDAVSEQLQRGTAFTMATEAEVRHAELLCARVPGFDKIRFVNSGTEAVMAMIKAARAYTGKPKIAKVEGAYHGCYDYAEVSQTSAPANWGDADKPASVPVAVGTPAGVLDDVVIIPFNDIDRSINILNQHAGEIACVMIDPLPHRIGLIPASNDFVNALKRWTVDNDALLVFDEVITFRLAYGGAQENYDITPDLTALGKIIGGGFPVGALAGRDEVMKVLDPSQSPLLLPHSGTFSANPMTMTAGRVTMEHFDRETVVRLNELANSAREKITAVIDEIGIDACITGAGSLFRIHLKAKAPRDYREAYASKEQAQLTTLLINHLFDHGVMPINTCTFALSTAMTSKEIDHLVTALKSGFAMLKTRMNTS